MLPAPCSLPPGLSQLALAPEDQLCLVLARAQLGLDLQEQACRLLTRPLRWRRIIEVGKTHGVLPLVYRNLQMLGFPGVPTQVQTELESLYKINGFRNVHLVEETAEVLKLLGGAGIPTIPLKGVTLAESLYGDSALRVCSDIDILVPRSNVSEAFRLLCNRGYRADFTEKFFADHLLRENIEYSLTREERGFRYYLELHWGMMLGPRFDKAAVDDLWAEARPKIYFGIPAYTLSLEWELLFLSVHAARHRWGELKWLVDIHEVCTRGVVDWEKLAEKAERLRLEHLVRLSLAACHALFGTPAPKTVTLTAIPSWVKLFPAAPSESWRDAFFPVRLLRRPSDKLRYSLRVIFVPTLAERVVRLPSFLSSLYYPLRPVRLGLKWSRRLFRVTFKQISS